MRWAWSQAVGYDVMGDTTAAGIFSMPGQRLGIDPSVCSPPTSPRDPELRFTETAMVLSD